MNAKQELQEYLIEIGRTIKCALLTQDDSYYDYDVDGDRKEDPKYILPLNFTTIHLTNFYNSLDFEYDNGFGGQYLYGTVWLDDNSWLSRGEYDGSEWWIHNTLPEIPAELLNVTI